MNHQQILSLYEQANALLNGHFVLSSGRHSARYLQSAKVLMYPDLAAKLAAELVSLVQTEEIDVVVAPALGGLIIGHEVARALNKPFIFTERKEGIMSLRRGFSFEGNERVLIVEDVITTGGSVRECIEVVRQHGGNPFKVMALVDRAPDQENRFDMPHQTLIDLNVESHDPKTCPMCQNGELPAIKPGSRGVAK
ncbi:MAG: orotate phosphoribosyltransferase [Mariprofundaceae bacterium]|nr:orotate phosphoribosyltransferase [Mariprofundaceae bacterium]